MKFSFCFAAFLLAALAAGNSAHASQIRCTEHFAGHVWPGEPASDIETAKDNAVTACTQSWIAPNDCFNARDAADAMSCNVPPPAGWTCTEHFAGHVWPGEPATDLETAKDNAVTACTQNWIAPNDCFRARDAVDAMSCRARQ